MNRLLIEVMAVILAAIGAYFYGCYVTEDHMQSVYDRDMSTIKAKNAESLAGLQADLRAKERDAAERVAAIDKQGMEKLQNETIKRDRIIDGLRSGAVQLRSRFACTGTNDKGGAGAPGTTTGMGDATKGGGLQAEDGTFLISEADRADQVALQLGACQAIAAADRQGK